MKKYLLKAPRSLITFAVVFVGINANLMSDAGTIFSFTMGELAARIIDAFLSVLQLGLALRRFHDLDRSWGSLFLLMIPFINLYFLFLLFCKKGNGWRQPLWPGSPHELREDPLMAEQLANNLWRLEIPLVG